MSYWTRVICKKCGFVLMYCTCKKTTVIKTKKERLEEGETFVTSEKGNSMTPHIKSGQSHRLAPTTWELCEIDDIVYCKVNGRFYTHLVKAKNDSQGLLIGNAHGRTNGWTKKVYGKVIEVL